MSKLSDYINRSKLGSVDLLTVAEATAQTGKYLQVSDTAAFTLSASSYPELSASGLFSQTPPWVHDTLTTRTTGGYYFAGHAACEFGAFEATPNLGSGPIKVFTHGGIYKSLDRGATWAHEARAAGPTWYYPTGSTSSAVNNSIIQDDNGDLYANFSYNISSAYYKTVFKSTDFGETWTQLWTPESHSGSNNYHDMALGTVAGVKRLVIIENNGRIITSDGPSFSAWTQRVAVLSGLYNFSIRWYPTLNGGAGLFVVMGDTRVITSPDGVTWTAQNLPASCRGVALTDIGPQGIVGYYPTVSGVHAAGSSRPVRSVDGLTWVAQPLILPLNYTQSPSNASTKIYSIFVWGGKYNLVYQHAGAGNSLITASADLTTDWAGQQISAENVGWCFFKIFKDCILLCPGYSASGTNMNQPNYNILRLLPGVSQIGIPQMGALAASLANSRRQYLRVRK